jgi:hypothetical protein
VFVHCQTKKRACGLTFLHRVIHGELPVDDAAEQLLAVWVPNADSKAFITKTLATTHIEIGEWELPYEELKKAESSMNQLRPSITARSERRHDVERSAVILEVILQHRVFDF